MATISAELRNHKEPTKDEITKMFFGIPEEKKREEEAGWGGDGVASRATDRMEINAVLSMGEQGVEDAYVRSTFLFSRFLLWLITETCIWYCRQGSCGYSRRTCHLRLWIGSRCGSRFRYARFGEWRGLIRVRACSR